MNGRRFQSLSALFAALAILPVIGQAEQLNLPGAGGEADNLRYTFIESSWITQDVDDLNVDGEGYALRTGMRLDPHLHIFANYTRTNLGPSGVDYESLLAGVGYAFDLSNNWDLIARAGWARPKIGGVDDDGWAFQGLVRGLIAQRLELEGGVQYVDLGSGDLTSGGGDDTSFLAAVRYNITDWFSVGLNGSVGGEVTEYGLSIRFSLE